MHGPSQATLQQAPWAQKPLAHSPLEEQAGPAGPLCPQPPAMQVAPLTHSSFATQPSRHAPVA
jgi:hypothetical protein